MYIKSKYCVVVNKLCLLLSPLPPSPSSSYLPFPLLLPSSAPLLSPNSPRQKVSRAFTPHIGIPIKTSAHSHQECSFGSKDRRYLWQLASFLPLIKSKTEQRNHHWHLVNVKLYHLFTTTHNQPWLESNKRKKKSPSQSESMHIVMFRNCAWWEPRSTRGGDITSTLSSYISSF